MHQLKIDQQFAVPVANLFSAWTQPNIIQKWFAPGEMTVPEAHTEVKEGGVYRIVMQDNDGSQHIIGGQYIEIVENQKLVFSWQWEGSPHATKVEVLFASIDNKNSSLSLIHSEFEDQDSCDQHQMGWNGCLANLQTYTNN